jgi:signal transduction histidine kinase
LGALVFLRIESTLEDQMKSYVESEMNYLLSEYYEEDDEGDDNLQELREAIEERIGMSPKNRLSYFLQNREGRVIFDDIPRIEAPYGWRQVSLPSPPTGVPKANERGLLLYSVALQDGYVLAIGADLTPLHDVERALRTAFLWAVLGTLLFGGIGGLVLSRRFLLQVDTITQTAERIGRGTLSERVPLRSTGDDLDHLATTINGMLDHIEQLVRNIRQVSTNIAHDLRTPLGRLRQKLELLGVASADDQLREEAAAEALQQVDEILEIFSALLRIAEIEAGSIKAGFAPVALAHVMENIVSAFQPSAEERSQSIISSLEPGISLYGDRSLLTQMFANLVENALRHTPDNAEIRLTLTRAKQEIIAGVADNGPGVPPEQYGHIFKSFYRLEQSRTRTGSGLGLSLVAAIAQLHGASIRLADNQPGLAVTIHFPVRT